MKRYIKYILAVLIVISFSVLAFNVNAESSISTENGFYTIEGKLYYRVNNKNVSGWFEVDGKTYYASLTTNVVINYSKKIGGKYYVWNEQTGLEIADGFVFDGTGYKCYDNGINVIGWRHEDGSGPKVVDGISEQYSQNPEGLYYFLSTTGYMITSETYKLGGYMRQFNDDHTVKAMEGLQTNAGELYYYINGVKQTGWHTVDGTAYYFRASDDVYGRAATKWMYIGNKVYYFYASTSSTPYALKTEGKIGGVEYTYSEDGHIQYNGFINCEYANTANSNTAINIQKKNATTRYYVNGEMQTGWQEIDGNIYYFYAIGSSMGSGYMCTESRTIGGIFYKFSENGDCINYICVSDGHNWQEANCTTPKTCLRCGETEGDIEHSIVNNKCTVCGYLKPSEGLEYEYLSSGYRVKNIGTCQDTNIVIPDIYNDKPVVSIGPHSFKNQTQIQSVVIPEGVLSIGNYAFSDCSNLISVSIPNSVLYIDYYAFFGCSSLKNVDLQSVVDIGSDAFRGCTSLESITIPNTLKRIGQNAFQSCSMLNSIYIYDIAAWCNIDFYDPTSNPLSNYGNLYLDGELITDLILPSNVKNIKKYSFCISENINSVIIPSGLKIELFAFMDSRIKIIYCEADSKPDEWSSLWKDRCNAVVYWGNQWEYVDGVPTVIQ